MARGGLGLLRGNSRRTRNHIVLICIWVRTSYIYITHSSFYFVHCLFCLCNMNPLMCTKRRLTLGHMLVIFPCHSSGYISMQTKLSFWFMDPTPFSFFLAALCGRRVPWPGMEPAPPAVEAQSLNRWTARKVTWLLWLLWFMSCLVQLKNKKIF